MVSCALQLYISCKAVACFSSWIPLVNGAFLLRLLDPFADIPRTCAELLNLRKVTGVLILRFSLSLFKIFSLMLLLWNFLAWTCWQVEAECSGYCQQIRHLLLAPVLCRAPWSMLMWQWCWAGAGRLSTKHHLAPCCQGSFLVSAPAHLPV